MNDLLIKGYAKRSMSPLGKTWYIPHNGMYHPSKPGKVCVIFECSAEFERRSIKSIASFWTILDKSSYWFLQKQLAFMADVESMYYQLMVPNNERAFLKFLWWNNTGFYDVCTCT